MESRLRLGVISGLGSDCHKEMAGIAELGLNTCQIACWDPLLYTSENVSLLKTASERYGIEITSIWAGYPGPAVWDFLQGPSTIGLVPPEYRAMRVEALKKGADFAAAVGVPSITTHAGFIPENPSDPLYVGTVAHCDR